MRLLFILIISSFCITATAQFSAEEKVLSTPTGELKGTLIVPSKSKKFSLMVLQAGSGPTDRNGNNPLGVKANSYRLLAEALAKENIGILLTDKRGIAASGAAGKKESELRFDDYITDLALWVRLMKKDRRIKKTFIAGHSEGSLIGMAAVQQEKVNGYISIAGAGERIDKIINRQLENQSPAMAGMVDSMLAVLRQGKQLDSVPKNLLFILRPSVQPYMASWMKYDPCAEISKIRIPVLILQGTTDLQVEMKEAQMLKACNPAATLKIISGMNHILKESSAEVKKNTATYSDPALPVVPALVAEIAKFIKQK